LSTIRSIEIASWASFVSHIDELSKGLREAPWFRGQCQDWPLRPHLLRHLRRGAIRDPESALRIEEKALNEFTRAAHFYLPSARIDQLNAAHRADTERVSWWTIMRHHRAPTRLLDWTLSPYVAAYFAAESPVDDDKRPPGVVWVLDFGALRAYMDGTYAAKDGDTRIYDRLITSPEAPDDLLPLFHQMPTERMLAQQGCFTVCRNVLGDHGEIIERTVPAALTRLLIPEDVKIDFRQRLRQVNLTAHSLFGDLDGLGRHTEETVTMLVDRLAPSFRSSLDIADPG
jgi:hypothetical protein